MPASSTRSFCPEALYGQHGVVNTSGNCPYCGHHLGVPREWTPGRAGRSGSLYDDELEQTSWGRRRPQESVVNPEQFLDEQDPLRGYDDQDWV